MAALQTKAEKAVDSLREVENSAIMCMIFPVFLKREAAENESGSRSCWKQRDTEENLESSLSPIINEERQNENLDKGDAEDGDPAFRISESGLSPKEGRKKGLNFGISIRAMSQERNRM